jgi:SWI/SNF-related matrix-associated actin-dependent regulator of chromatin subfamily D
MHPAQMAQAQAQQAAQAQAAMHSMRKRAQTDNLMGPGIKAVKRGRPTTRALPPSITRTIPESAMYQDLVRIERSLDWTVARKRAEVQDALGRNTKVKRTLRVFLSNTCSGQPFQVEAKRVAAEKAGVSVEDKEEIPSWTLRVEGRLLEPSFKSRAHTAQALQAAQNRTTATKFSNLIRTVVVELVRDPSLYPAGENIVEWHRPNPSVAPATATMPAGGESSVPGTGALDVPTVAAAEPALDGFEVKRTGTIPVKARIVIYLAHTPEKFALSPELAALLDIREETRQSVISALWAYIKEHKLLSEEDRRLVICNDALRAIFRTDRIAFHHIPEVVNRHLHPPAPVVLEYWVRTDKDVYKHPTAFDIEVEVEDSGLRKVQDEVLAGFELRGREIAELDDRIAQATQSLENRTSTRDFLYNFAKDPYNHIQTWTASQARDLDSILGTNYATGSHLNIGTEELRRSETFKAPWVEQAVIVHEAQRVADKMQTLQRSGAPTSTGNQSAGGPIGMTSVGTASRPGPR